ncbi:hypothetical protein MKZ38_010547 [Zalerion maritima]|uniref:Uncharacterized protein n=1 Tax=Zalerion maritima TaxID=339359 RepID=A0AAD5WUG4_9PEZI|nr:hypothetical protein MKZ38_010547 [Zalerion maritima]
MQFEHWEAFREVGKGSQVLGCIVFRGRIASNGDILRLLTGMEKDQTTPAYLCTKFPWRRLTDPSLSAKETIPLYTTEDEDIISSADTESGCKSEETVSAAETELTQLSFTEEEEFYIPEELKEDEYSTEGDDIEDHDYIFSHRGFEPWALAVEMGDAQGASGETMIRESGEGITMGTMGPVEEVAGVAEEGGEEMEEGVMMAMMTMISMMILVK